MPDDEFCELDRDVKPVIDNWLNRDFHNAFALFERMALALCIDLANHYSWQRLEGFSFDECALDIGVPDSKRHLLRCVLRILSEHDCMSLNHGVWKSPRSFPSLSFAALSKQASQQFPDEPLFQLLIHCADQMTDVLEGKKTGLQVIFPRGDQTLWTALHDRSMFVAPHADLAATAVAALMSPRTHVFEMGAGTGSTTRRILAKIHHGDLLRYTWTDLASRFVQSARETFHHTPNFHAIKFDMDGELLEQGADKNSVDIVVAVNTLHAAEDLNRTLRLVYEILRPGGWLVLGEGSPPGPQSIWRGELILGMIDGWWDVKCDPIYRPTSGFLLTEHWMTSFDRSGFVDVATRPEYTRDEKRFGGVYLARKPWS